ncbi:MAG: signal transduction histidine kinase [Neobacillus sp.]|nr:signal transduction histidine kinase [Neobacillus sp.]
MTRSIFFKLFVIMVVGISIFIGSMMLVQTTFFTQYYIYKKSVAIKDTLKDLPVKNSDYTGSYAQSIMSYFILNNGGSMTIFIKQPIIQGNDENTGSDQGKSSEPTNAFYFSSSIQTDERSSDTINQSSVDISSTVTDSEFIKSQIRYSSEIYEREKELLDSGRSYLYEAHDGNDVRYIISVTAIPGDESTRGLFVTFSSLQPVLEAASVINDYYVIFFIAALVLVVALSFAFSRQLAKPLIHLNDVSSRIAELDFTKECNIKSRDELGNLSKTINKLAGNIKSYIVRLNETNASLQQELRRERELDVMRNEFVAGASHELKTPITVIQGYLHGLQDKMDKGEPVDDYFEIINDETQRMSTLISDMLELSRLDSGKVELQLEPLSISRLISYVLRKLYPKINEKQLKIIKGEADDSVLAFGDSSRIEQVLFNLLSNAINYNHYNGVIKIEIIILEGRQVIEIENSGPHIPDEDLDRIWDKFYRVDKSRSKLLGGTGLGLSITKKILELHNCDFGVFNTSIGVKFYFALENFEQKMSYDLLK